jgi:hypothetical protein
MFLSKRGLARVESVTRNPAFETSKSTGKSPQFA